MSEDFTPTNPETARKAIDFVEAYVTSLLTAFPIPDPETIAEVEGDEDAEEFTKVVNLLLEHIVRSVRAAFDDFRRDIDAESN
jgi:hypothetical protein